MNSKEQFEGEKPTLWVNTYAKGEVSVCLRTQKMFDDHEAMENFFKEKGAVIKLSLNIWSKERYGREIFGGYADGESIRIQTGLHDLTEEDKEKIQEVVIGVNNTI